jgi:hypothetical protein
MAEIKEKKQHNHIISTDYENNARATWLICIFRETSKTKGRNTIKYLSLCNWWAHLDSNQAPTDYESVALTE